MLDGRRVRIVVAYTLGVFAPMIDFFIHLPKTGGTTLSTIIRNNVRLEGRFDHDSLNGIPITMWDMTPEQRSQVRYVLGHYFYGAFHHLFTPTSFRYFTMLRDPVERVLSEYSFVPGQYGYEWAKGLSLAEYVERCIDARNLQTIMLSSSETRPDVERAKANLQTFAAVGITEQFDKSLAVMARVFGWKNTSYKRTNITEKRVKASDLSADEIALVRKHNAMDIELYEFAKGMLTRELMAA